MFFTLEKLRNRMNELEQLRYRDRKNILSFSSFEPVSGQENYFPASFTGPELELGGHWSGRDYYLWVNTEVEIPHKWEEKQSVVFFDMGRTGGGNNAGFESMFYLNRHAFQGVDSNHREVLLPKGVSGHQQLTLQLWSGLEGGGEPAVQYYQVKEAWIAWLDQASDEYYYLMRAILESIDVLGEHDAIRTELLSILNMSTKEIQWSSKGEELFYKSVEKALKILSEKISAIHIPSRVKIRAIGHSHIDLAWLWRTKHTKEKAVRTFRTVLRLMELYPEYIYLQSQPQLYEWIKEQDPELYNEMKQKIASGQWEAEGSMWVEADCNIPSGESFIRQILYGKRFFKKEFNKDTRSLWLPDVFGYSWSLPQILKKSGIDTFMTTKISWNQYNRMPHDTFIWKGMDGSEVLTHFITTPEPGRPKESWFYTYNGLISAETVDGIWKQYRDKEVNQDLLLAYGYGDGGGGVNRDMIEMKHQLDKVPGMPNVESGTAATYFTNLHKTINQSDAYVHTWDGELYLEYHRGTYTSQAKMKKENRKLEFAYRNLELLAVLCSLKNGFEEYPSEQIQEGWKIILLNQFHDIIPGSSIREVYEDAHKDYKRAWAIHDQLKEWLLNELMEERQGTTSLFSKRAFTAPVLLENDMHPVLISSSKGPGLTLLDCDQVELGNSSVIRVMGNRLSTPFYEIEWNEQGQLSSIFDKKKNREILDGRGNVFKMYEDRPMAHDAWDIDLYYFEKSEELRMLVSCEVVQSSVHKTEVAFKWKHKDAVVSQKMIVYSFSKRIDFVTSVDWKARQQLLKVEFPINIRSTEGMYDVQFGNVKRPNHWNNSWDMARFESVGHKWTALSEPLYGVSLLNDSKYGYGIKDNVLTLSLLKGPVYPDPEADIGTHKFTYALFPFEGITEKHKIEEESLHLNDPPEILENCIVDNKGAIVHVDQPVIFVDTIKKAEDRQSVIVRFHEMEGGTIDTTVESSYPISRWRKVNLMEEAESEWFKTDTFVLRFKPYEICTIEIEFV